MDQREVARRYARRWRAEKAKGVVHSIPIEPVAQHVDMLMMAGGTTTSIGEAAGVCGSIIGELARRQRQRIQVVTARKILAVQVSDLLEHGPLVSSVGAIRRVRALLAIGHTHAEINSRLPSTASRQYTMNLLSKRWPRIARGMHDAICRVYDDLSMTPGRSQVTRKRAKREGYRPPLWWDEADLDDPYAEAVARPVDDSEAIDWVAVERRIQGDRSMKLTTAEATEAVRRMYAQGMSWAQIATRTGLKAERYLTKTEWEAAS